MELLARASSSSNSWANTSFVAPNRGHATTRRDATELRTSSLTSRPGAKRRREGNVRPSSVRIVCIVFVSDRTDSRSVGRPRRTPNLCAHFSITAFLTPARPPAREPHPPPPRPTAVLAMEREKKRLARRRRTRKKMTRPNYTIWGRILTNGLRLT